ncbi:unnamed protein product [Heligmosomoides polygyrus]|uniref:Uncharacterized protein n=1 Tax=Heligmosomoides polygyrus TaxID=6339 RepID=A0A183FWA4_HELPZ|nr:unnamed protein product [Heligmosomoides polygyrus]
METKMLRWTAGVTRMERIRNDLIRQKFSVVPIAGKMREARLRWYDHVQGGKEDSVGSEKVASSHQSSRLRYEAGQTLTKKKMMMKNHM